MKPIKRWTALDRQTFRLKWRGMTWTLAATPRAKYPWLLSDGDGATQEIGQRDTADAQGMAEFWLEVNSLYGSLAAPKPVRAAA